MVVRVLRAVCLYRCIGMRFLFCTCLRYAGFRALILLSLSFVIFAFSRLFVLCVLYANLLLPPNGNLPSYRLSEYGA